MSVAGVHCLALSLPPGSLRNSSIPANGKHTQSLLLQHFSVAHHTHRKVTSFSHNASGKSDAEPELEPSYHKGEMLDKNETSSKNPFVSEELLKKLKRYGVSGILSYGLLNTVYYTIAFLLVWFYVAPAPGKMGYLAAAESLPLADRFNLVLGETNKYDGGQCSDPGTKPEWPTENPFENGNLFYVLNNSEVEDNDWIRLYLELAVAKVGRSNKDPDLSNLKIVSVAMDTRDLNAKNTTVYIGYKDSCEARVGKDVDRIAMVRRTFGERTGCFTLMGRHQSLDLIPKKGACEAGVGKDVKSSFNEHTRCLSPMDENLTSEEKCKDPQSEDDSCEAGVGKGKNLTSVQKCKYQRVIRGLGVLKPWRFLSPRRHKAYKNHGFGLARRLHKTRSI